MRKDQHGGKRKVSWRNTQVEKWKVLRELHFRIGFSHANTERQFDDIHKEDVGSGKNGGRSRTEFYAEELPE